MPRPARVRPADSSTPSAPLSVNDLLFVNAYLENGRNGKQAYLAVHPGIKANSAEVGACRVLSQAKVQQEIATRIQSQGWGKETAVASCLSIRDRAAAKGALDTELRAIAELNDLAGLKVNKVQDVTAPPSVNEDQLREALRVRGFVAVPGN